MATHVPSATAAPLDGARRDLARIVGSGPGTRARRAGFFADTGAADRDCVAETDRRLHRPFRSTATVAAVRHQRTRRW